MGNEHFQTDRDEADETANDGEASGEGSRDAFTPLKTWEQQYGRYLAYALLLVVIVVQIGMLFSGSDVVRAEKFVLQDQNGNTRAVLGKRGTGNEVGLFVMDRSGTDRIQLSQAKNTSGLYLFNKDGTDRVQIFQDGTKKLSGMALFDQNRTNRLQISQDGKNKMSALRMFDRGGTRRVWLGLLENRSYIDLYDQKGSRFWSAQ